MSRANDFKGSLALYRLLLRLYPEDFRRRFGNDMAEEVRMSLREAYDARGLRGICHEWFRLFVDLSASLRHAGRPPELPPNPRPSPRLPAVSVMDTLLLDIRHAARALRRRPAFTALAVLYLALGIGANTAMFSVIDAALFRPLPYPEAENIAKVRLQFQHPDGRAPVHEEWSYPYYRAFDGATADIFDGTAALHPTFVNVATPDGPVRTPAELVSDRYFDILGVRPAAGRFFRPEDDDVAGAGEALVVAHGAAVAWFGGADDALGRRLVIGGLSLEIVGVAPGGFSGVSGEVELWLPFSLVPVLVQPNYLESAGWFWHHVLGKLRPEVAVESLPARMEALRPVLDATYSENAVITPRVVSLRESMVDGNVRSPLAFLQGAVLFILAIACTNVAVLMLARSVDRSREIATRVAIGAGRVRLLRQLLAEACLLGVFGAVAGSAVAVGLRALLLPAIPSVTTDWTSYGLVAGAAPLDARVFLFALALGLVSGLLFALAPVFSTLKASPRAVLQGAAGAPRRGFGIASVRSALPAVQVALAVLLLGGAVLMVRTLQAKRGADPGFDATNVVVARVQLDTDRYPGGTGDFYLPLLERLRALPDVESASLATSLAYGGISYRTNLAIEGVDNSFEDFEARRRVRMHFVERDFFQTIRLRLRTGRIFDARDVAGAPDVAVVNRTLAEQLFPGEDPVGRRVAFGLGRGGRQWFEIVGVVEDAYYRGVDDVIEPEAYIAYRQTPPGSAYVYVRTKGDAASFVPALRSAVAQLDDAVALYAIQTLEEAGATSRAETRSFTALLSGFAALALLLAAGGLYGTMAYAVAARTRELGIRKSLGATQGALIADVLGRGLRLTLAGVAFGYLAAMWLARLLEARLWGVEPYDPVTGVATGAVLLLTGVAASLIPAVRASRADPVTALRGE